MQLSKALIIKVRIAFLEQETSLSEYCRKNNLDRKNMHRYLRGEINSPKAIMEREKVIKAANITLDLEPS